MTELREIGELDWRGAGQAAPDLILREARVLDPSSGLDASAQSLPSRQTQPGARTRFKATAPMVAASAPCAPASSR